MIAYMAFSQNPVIDEKARFCASVLTIVKTPEKMAHIKAVIVMERGERSHGTVTMNMLAIGPNIPTIDDIAQSL